MYSSLRSAFQPLYRCAHSLFGVVAEMNGEAVGWADFYRRLGFEPSAKGMSRLIADLRRSQRRTQRRSQSRSSFGARMR